MKRKVDPLIEHGHRVFISYDSDAFESRTKTTRSGWSYQTNRNPTEEFKNWLTTTAGPMGILWKSQKDSTREGLEIFFYNPSHAMLAKLTWGGR